MVICLQRGADLHMAQLTPLPLTVSCFSKIQIGFTFLVPAHQGSPGRRAVKRVCVCVCVCVCTVVRLHSSDLYGTNIHNHQTLRHKAGNDKNRCGFPHRHQQLWQRRKNDADSTSNQ